MEYMDKKYTKECLHNIERKYILDKIAFIDDDLKEQKIVVVFGWSDDLMEFRGFIEDEIDCFEGGKVLVERKALCLDLDREGLKYIEALWCKGDFTWSYKTDIPHETFDVYDDGEKYCKGIIFSMEDL